MDLGSYSAVCEMNPSVGSFAVTSYTASSIKIWFSKSDALSMFSITLFLFKGWSGPLHDVGWEFSLTLERHNGLYGLYFDGTGPDSFHCSIAKIHPRYLSSFWKKFPASLSQVCISKRFHYMFLILLIIIKRAFGPHDNVIHERSTEEQVS
jgi:hypothetical protein